LVNSGSGKKSQAPEYQAFLDRARQSDDVTIKELSPKSDITETAAQGVSEGYGKIVAAGGDGTISGICAALAGNDVTLGIVPLGTFNFFARSLGIPQDPLAAWEVIAEGHHRQVSIGAINGQRFINNASIGAYASVLQVREDVYKRWGRSRLTAYWSVIKAAATLYRSLNMRITVDGVTHELRSPMVFAAVRPYQLDYYDLPGAQTIREGELVVYLAPNGGRINLLWRAFKVLIRQVENNHDYTMLSGREIKIETFRRERLVAWDGERSRMQNPFHLTMLQDGLRVIVPAPDKDNP